MVDVKSLKRGTVNDKRVGIIGYGSMGSMLLDGLCESEIMRPSLLCVSTKTKEKILHLKSKGIAVCESNEETAEKSDLLFLCVRPLEFKELLTEIKPALNPEKHVVSIAGSLTIKNIETVHGGKISRVIPTFVSAIREGVTLVCHNTKVLESDKDMLVRLLSGISTVRTIPEEEFELISQLTSCAPGIFAEIFKEYVEAAARYTAIDRKQLSYFVIETLFGTAKLLKNGTPDFDEIVRRVATKGGATEAGVEVLHGNLPSIFGEMFQKTLERQNMRKKKLDEQFS
jgi:pyrroline-5-carboxylate reductase